MKIMKRFSAAAAFVLVVLLMTSTVFAAEPDGNGIKDDAISEDELIVDDSQKDTGDQVLPPKDQLDKIEARTGSIKIHLTDGKAGTKKEGIKFSCLKVADVISGDYILSEAYKDSGIDLNTIENSVDLKTAAEKLLTYKVQGNKIESTDQEGTVTFKDLPVGVYLISAEDYEAYDTVEPALIAIPTWNDTAGEMQYDVTMEPKHTPKTEKEKNTAPQTNLEDHTRQYLFAGGLCFIGACILAFIGIRKRKYEKSHL